MDKQSRESEKQIAVIKEQMKQNSDEHQQIQVSLNRIEAKLDAKVDNSDLVEIKQQIINKANKEEIKSLDTKFWQLIFAIVVAFIGIIATGIKVFLEK